MNLTKGNHRLESLRRATPAACVEFLAARRSVLQAACACRTPARCREEGSVV